MNEADRQAAKAGAIVTRKGPLRYWILAYAVLAFGLTVERSSASHREHEDRGIWFVHATDPHLFLKALQVDEKKDAKGAKEEREKKNKQEELNQKALTDMLKRIVSLPDSEGPPAFLVLTGDLGIDPCEIPKAGSQPATATTAEEGIPPPGETPNGDKQRPKDKRSAQDCVNAAKTEDRKGQIDKIAELLGESPVPNIYLVAGNNDIAKESAGGEALKYFNTFIDDVQKELIKNKSSVVLHNLTRCYAPGGDPAGCYSDVDPQYRLIGFPSYSFKGAKDEAGLDHDQTQEEQFARFRQLLGDARKAGRKVLVVTHTPQMDDPFALAQQRYVNPASTPAETATLAATPTPAETVTPAKNPKKEAETNKSSSVATWKVSEKLLDDWKDVIASDSIAGVFAGHLHDSHKEIYRPPYAWSSGSQTAFHKLFLAPPLAIKNQTDSPIQARGFSLVHLQPDRIESRVFWYDSETRAFTPDSKAKPRCERPHFWRSFCQCPRSILIWLWNLDQADTAMVRMAVLLIAFLTAFLTIVAIWQFPPGSDRFAEDKKDENASRTAPNASNASADSSPFSNRFGKTVIAGLSGLAVTEIAKALGNEKSTVDTRWYYIVWFILFFFFLLLLLNFWRALVEASRARVAVIHYPLGLPGSVGTWDRFTYWLSSLRVPLLTFSDTFINLIQGKNQTRTKVFEDRIVDQQKNVIRVADAIRTSLSHLIEARVRQGRQDAASPPVSSGPVPLPNELNLVRVNISVLSKDQTNVFYVSRAPGSSHSQFPTKSVAWVSVFTGQIRWYQSAYQPDIEEIVLFDNHKRNERRVIPDENDLLMFKDYYQIRDDEDYKAFVVFPVPSPRRGFGSDYVKGAIHISFRRDSDFDCIWDGNVIKPVEKADAEPVADSPAKPPPIYYRAPQRMLEDWCMDDGIRAALSNSIAALGELLRGFNEIIYKNYIEADQPD